MYQGAATTSKWGGFGSTASQSTKPAHSKLKGPRLHYAAFVNAFTVLCHPPSSRLLFVETLGNGYCLHDLRWGRWSPRRLHSLLNPQSPSSVVVGVCTTTVIHFGIKGCQQFRNRYGPTNGYCSYCSRQCYRHAAQDEQQLAVKSLFSHSSPPSNLPTFRSTMCSLAVNLLPLSFSLLAHSATFSSLIPSVLCKCQTKRNRENLPLDTEIAP
ncbi:hypothetical protein BKA56DRAFT_328865 [Ilyonectria sp. MPI-CAGE-AT-0026]|nr:hypothetical protein BKA56DRAFT_328865 [Ilyonectria sp. MPI-CAGE-AT-0026]